MWFAKRRRWQWMVAGAIVGGALGVVYGTTAGEDLLATAPVIGDQATFENMLLQADNGVPRFRDIVVHPYRPPDGAENRRAVFVLSGRYHEGSSDDAGRMLWFQGTCPYKAGPALPRVVALAKINDLGTRYAAIPDPTIRDYLSVLQQGVGLEYRYAWWEEPALRFLLWSGGGFVIVGVICPTLVYLVAFGRLSGPPSNRVDSPSATDTVSSIKPQPSSAEDLTALRRLEAELEEAMAVAGGEPPDAVPQPASPTFRPEPKRRFTEVPQPSEPVVGDSHDTPAESEFAMKPEDFYPTEHRRRNT
jgi:hypothetical protein